MTSSADSHPSTFKRSGARGRKSRVAAAEHVAQHARRAASRDLTVHQHHLGRIRASASKRSNPFRRFAHTVSTAAGKPWTFAAAVALIVAWGISGPLFGFSDTWQLVINTSTTIITFLMVFLIQNTQNRDTEALRLKLDELILATASARNEFVQIEDMDDEDLLQLERDLKDVGQKGGSDDEPTDDGQH